MDRLEIKYRDALRAFKAFKDILDEPPSKIIQDASIQRFEYSFDALWKFIKEFLKTREGIIVNSPKSCFREMNAVGHVSNENRDHFLAMTDCKNEISISFKDELSESLIKSFKIYADLMDDLLSRLQQVMEK